MDKGSRYEELTDEEIVRELAKHGIGMLGHTSDVEPFPLGGDDAPIFIAAYRALLARSPAPALEDIEQYRLQMAGISTAAIGYWKEGDGIHPDYDTPALRDVARLYAKYAELHAAAPEQKAAQPAAVPVAVDEQAPPLPEPYGGMLRKALEDFRDAVLNSRGHLEEGTLDNDQTNAVLAAFDDIVGEALAAQPEQSEPVYAAQEQKS